jgi:hypothetical protein
MHMCAFMASLAYACVRASCSVYAYVNFITSCIVFMPFGNVYLGL